jgi:hypothetical protein
MLGAWLTQFVPKRMEKRLVMMLGCLFTGLSLFIVGPSTLLHLPHSLPLMILGQSVLGLCRPFCFIHALPEMTESVEPLYTKE